MYLEIRDTINSHVSQTVNCMYRYGILRSRGRYLPENGRSPESLKTRLVGGYVHAPFMRRPRHCVLDFRTMETVCNRRTFVVCLGAGKKVLRRLHLWVVLFRSNRKLCELVLPYIYSLFHSLSSSLNISRIYGARQTSRTETDIYLAQLVYHSEVIPH